MRQTVIQYSEAFKRHPKLCAWWESMSARPSVAATVSPLEQQGG